MPVIKSYTENPYTDCFYELPDDADAEWVRNTANTLEQRVATYVGRVGNRFFFRFRNSQERNVFLSGLRLSAIEDGYRYLIINPEVMRLQPPPKPKLRASLGKSRVIPA